MHLLQMGSWFRKVWPKLVYVGAGLVLAALGLLLFGPSFDVLDVKESSTHLNASTETEGVVEQVVDGDTIELSNGMRVRYIGLDTPEIRQHINGEWTYRPQRLAEEARAFNQNLVEGKKVHLEYDEERSDRYHRELAYVFVGDLFVNAEMIRSGYARVSLHSPNLKYSSLFLKLQKQARNEQKGVWSPGRKAWQENLSVEIPADGLKMLGTPDSDLFSPQPVGTVH
ncbi:MAG: thermonuclease family protein [Nitrospira sp.]|nr:thermonuclease family protein [Nitrospira sp.]